MNTYCTYLRVSTQRQGAQGLGISAQRGMCDNFIKQNKGKQVQEFMDVESGTHRERKGLWDAIDYCKKNGCSLVIAKLDRLARDVEFTFKVINTGIDIHFTDMPVVNSMILGVFAAVAQYEREMVSTRTKQALAALKARGDVKLGAASEKWQRSFKAKSEEEKIAIAERRGKIRSKRYKESREVTALLKILRNVFPDACKAEDPRDWKWARINTKGDNKTRVISLMRDYKELDADGTLFSKWNFDASERELQMKLSSTLHTIKRSLSTGARVVG